MKKNNAWVILPLTLLLFTAGFITGPGDLYTVKIDNSQQLFEFFSYSKDRIPFVCAHRGGARKGFPENCIATFENTLKHTFTMMEIDPHYTKDSAIVLMHDHTLDRTSNGTGKVSNYTLQELKELKLKDPDGNITDYGIPTLDEALVWAKGRTILVIDQKDVPIEARVRKIQQHQAQASAIVIAYSLEDVKKCYQMDTNIIMEVMLPDVAACQKFEAIGVPYKNVVAFVSHLTPKDPAIFDYLHQRGVMCIRGSSRNIDRDYWKAKSITANELKVGYQQMVNSGTDIIEADLGIEAGEALKPMFVNNSNKRKFFNYFKE